MVDDQHGFTLRTSGNIIKISKLSQFRTGIPKQGAEV